MSRTEDRKTSPIAAPAALVAALAMAALLHAAPARASADEGAACLGHIASEEKAHDIPDRLLQRIGFAESGRTIDGRRVAWPWTVNAQGQGHYFETKGEAVEFVRGLQASGVSVIDVGCMQVNLHYHPKAFASLDQAFDPATNVAYAADFLTWLEDETSDWSTAARYYHSRTPSLGARYAARLTLNASGQVISSVGPVKRLTREEKAALAAEIPARLALTDELLARSRAMRQPKAASLAEPMVETAALEAIVPAAGPAAGPVAAPAPTLPMPVAETGRGKND